METHEVKIIKPVIVVGSGRSGTTIFHKVLSHYNKLAGISVFANNSPNNFTKHKLFIRGIDIPILGPRLMKRYSLGEAYEFWDYYCKGFSTPFRDLSKDDLDKKTKQKLINGMSQLLSNSRNRLLLKLTGWPRLSYLKAIFPDAKFIHVLRDGRAVANSLINVDFWWGWRGPSNWRWGELNDQQRTELEKHNKSFIALAAIQWKMIMDTFEIAKENINHENYLEVKYEELCKDPHRVYEQVFEFSELELTKQFRKIIANTSFNNTNLKWEKDLNETQKLILNDVLHEYLIKYHYK